MYRGCQGDGDGPQFTNLTVSDCSTAEWGQVGEATGAWCSINLDRNNNGNYGEIKDSFEMMHRFLPGLNSFTLNASIRIAKLQLLAS